MQIKKRSSIKEKLSNNKEKLIKAIEKTPEALSQEGSVLRVKFACNTDKSNKKNEPQMVFQLNSNKDITGNANQIASLICDRRMIENREITINIMSLHQDLSSGKIKLNEDLMFALLELNTTSTIMLNNVNNSYLKDWITISSTFYESGIPVDVIDNMKADILDLANESLMAHTDEEGNCPFHKQEHLANNLLTISGQKKIAESNPDLLVVIKRLNSSRPGIENNNSM